MTDYFLSQGNKVLVLDNLSTGNLGNIHRLDHPGLEFERRDICHGLPINGEIDIVINLASPASPDDYSRLPMETLEVGSTGTRSALELAKRKGAIFFMASTSEVYGDPKQHPQSEGYYGNVNPTGPRSVYDEAKRFSEALTTAYHKNSGVDVRIARIFNTYGPRMRRNDGRAVPNFICQALQDKPLTIYGDGKQTRSLMYVTDLISGIDALLRSSIRTPVNIGNPIEISVLDLAMKIRTICKSSSTLEFRNALKDDPVRRCPDITLARFSLNWSPKISLDEGLAMTANHVSLGMSRT